MTIDSLTVKRRNLIRKIKTASTLTDNEWLEIIKFYISVLTEIENCVESIPIKDDNVLHVVALERVKAVLQAANGLEDIAIPR